MNSMMIIYSLMLSFLFNQISHPLTMGLILILQTILITLLIGTVNFSFWFSYILFLIFVGGMLILFMYTISIISDEKFNFMMQKKMIYLFFIMMSLFILNYNYLYMNYNFKNMELMNMKNMKMLKMESSLMLNKFFNFPTNMINLMMMMYLFFLLIITVYMINFFKGPMRLL